MKTKIQELIQEQKFAVQELHSLLEELSQVDDSKLSPVDKTHLECSKITLSSENSLRLSFISSLENLL